MLGTFSNSNDKGKNSIVAGKFKVAENNELKKKSKIFSVTFWFTGKEFKVLENF